MSNYLLIVEFFGFQISPLPNNCSKEKSEFIIGSIPTYVLYSLFQAQRRLQAYQNYWLKLLNARSGNRAYNTNPRTTTTPRTTSTTTTTTKRPSSSPSSRLTSIIEKSSGSCGVRYVNTCRVLKNQRSAILESHTRNDFFFKSLSFNKIMHDF